MADDLTERIEDASYEELYRICEESHWNAAAIGFGADAEQWNRLDERRRHALLWSCSPLLAGEEALSRILTPTLDAAPEPYHRALLATQVVADARHYLLLDRFLQEACRQGPGSSSVLDAARGRLTWGFGHVLEDLERVADALRKKPRERPLLAQTIAVCHIILKGVVLASIQRFIGRYVGGAGVLPGFSAGGDRMAADEARHVAFGIKLLAELIGDSTDCRAAAVETMDRALLATMAVFIPPPGDGSLMESLDFTLSDINAFALRSLDEELRRLGVDRSELRMLSYQDVSASYEERARQVGVLIEAGVVGDDHRRSVLTPEAFEILFAGMSRMLDVDTLRSLGGAIEWDFSDAEPWHVVATDDHAEAKLGRAGTPALRLEISSEDFAKLSVGRTDPRWALLKRRLRVHGHLSAKAKLPKLFR